MSLSVEAAQVNSYINPHDASWQEMLSHSGEQDSLIGMFQSYTDVTGDWLNGEVSAMIARNGSSYYDSKGRKVTLDMGYKSERIGDEITFIPNAWVFVQERDKDDPNLVHNLDLTIRDPKRLDSFFGHYSAKLEDERYNPATKKWEPIFVDFSEEQWVRLDVFNGTIQEFFASIAPATTAA